MLPKEILEWFHWLEERVHWLGGMLACCFVLTWAGKHWQPTAAAVHGEWVERLDRGLIVLDIVVAVMFVGGVLFKTFGIKKVGPRLKDILLDSYFSRLIPGWFTDAPPPVAADLKVRFCSDACYDELISLNYDAFRASSFAVEREKLERRNRRWLQRHPRIFMLILDPLVPARTLGYSAMLPLTAEGLESYLDGALKDADIPASLVAENHATAAAVLIFAIYLKDEYSFTKTMAARNYTAYFLECVRYHLWALFDEVGKYPPIYLQTEGSGMERRVRRYGFVDSGRISADGFRLLVLEHPFQAAPVLTAAAP